MTGTVVLSDVDEAIALFRLNRPNALNALDFETVRLLTDLLVSGGDDPAVRAVVLTGAGGNFSAGDDLKEAARMGAHERDELIAAAQNLTRVMRGCSKPIIAAIDGYAVGGGLEITLACDLRIASDRAKFCTPEVARGLLISNGTSLLLPRLIGDSAAREMLFTGRMYDAAWALRVGLVAEVVPHDRLEAAARDLALQIAAGSNDAMAATKQLLNRVDDTELMAAINAEQAMAAQLPTDDAQLRIAEFLVGRDGGRDPVR